MEIKSELIKATYSGYGELLVTLKITFPRIILSEFNTHRMLVKNTSSSRAIPLAKMIEMVGSHGFVPYAFQKAHKGMQGTEYLIDKGEIARAQRKWLEARDHAIDSVKKLGLIEDSDENVTKQLCNRLLEPFSWTTMLVTGNIESFEHFFHLREFVYKKHMADKIGLDSSLQEKILNNIGAAEIHISILAEEMKKSIHQISYSKNDLVSYGNDHIPFDIGFEYGRTDRLNVSVMKAAQTSYTALGASNPKITDQYLKKANDFVGKLKSNKPMHASPFEHIGIRMVKKERELFVKTFCEDKNTNISQQEGWCGPFKGFIPLRETLK